MTILPPLMVKLSMLAMVFALAFPCAAEAVGIGEVIMQSSLGEPLLAQVDLTVERGERIDSSCLYLAAPDPLDEDISGYLTKATLAFITEGKRQYVAISSRKPFNDAFARLRLQIKCPGTGNVIKTLTLLPDLVTPLAPISPPVADAEEGKPSAPPPAVPPPANRQVTLDTEPVVKTHVVSKTARPVHKRHLQSAPSANRNQISQGTFRLKLSGDPLDESRIGKISADERASLLARQKLLDADDQMASFLAMQQQVKQLQVELGEIKSQLTKLGVTPATLASTGTLPTATTVQPVSPSTTMPQENHPKPANAAKQPVPQQNNPDLQNGLFATLGLLLIILALWQGLRHYAKTKSLTGNKLQADTGPALKWGSKSDVIKMGPPTSSKPALKDPAPFKIPPEGEVVPQESLSRNPVAAAPAPASPRKIEVTSEEDSMLEEAELYSTHGRPAKAAEILQDIIKQNPSKVEAWTLLLSIYSSLAKAAEFERTAREFLIHHEGSPSWSGIQALGRTFDQSNPLYADYNSVLTHVPILPDGLPTRRPVGDILIEMGVLSKQDLQSCLDTFDPKKHGRFGGYLVARKAITLAQLDQALLQQQGVGDEVKADTMPSLQDMENFLVDFDPKKHGSVGEFLASRNAATPEQLNKLLRKKPASGAVAEIQKTKESPSLNNASKEFPPEISLNFSNFKPPAKESPTLNKESTGNIVPVYPSSPSTNDHIVEPASGETPSDSDYDWNAPQFHPKRKT